MKRVIILLVFLQIISSFRSVTGEAYYRNIYANRAYYHNSPNCILAEEVQRIKLHTTLADEVAPCPVCIQDDNQYPGVEACARGGTVVLRIPDEYLAMELRSYAMPCLLPDELLHVMDKQEEDLARLIHGENYLGCLTMTPGDEKSIDAYIPVPQLMKGDLLMSQRHLGAAWYFVIRQNKTARNTMADSAVFEMSFCYYCVPLRVRSWKVGLSIEDAGNTVCKNVKLKIKVKHSANKVIYHNEAIPEDNHSVTVFKDRDVYTCVIHDISAGIKQEVARWAHSEGFWTELKGYLDNGETVFCMVLTKGELLSLQDNRYHFVVSDVPNILISTYDDACNAADPDYKPISKVALANGSIVEMIQDEYPVGTPYLRYKQIRPCGGIASYESDLSIEKLSNNSWRPLGSLYAYTGRNLQSSYYGWFCDEVQLVVPLDNIGALTEGLYRLRVSGMAEGEDTMWIEFNVKDGAPQPELPEIRDLEGTTLSAHIPPNAVLGYNSCQDATQRKVDKHRQLLLIEETVFDLRENYEHYESAMLDYGISYNLFYYPIDHPDQAMLLLENLQMTDVIIFDGGDCLLFQSCDYDEDSRLFSISYDGRSIVTSERLFPRTDPAFEALLLVEDKVFAITRGNEIWMKYQDSRERYVDNRFAMSSQPLCCLQYADGILLAADDNGILAIDTTASDAQGLMPCKRLTSAYDDDEDACGMGYIVLNGRLYCWSEENQATISMKLDGGDRQVVSGEHFYFSGVSSEGAVLAMTNLTRKGPFDGCESARLYLPDDPANPNFDPERCRAYTLPATGNAFLFGDYLWQIPADGRAEILTPLSDIQPD